MVRIIYNNYRNDTNDDNHNNFMLTTMMISSMAQTCDRDAGPRGRGRSGNHKEVCMALDSGLYLKARGPSESCLPRRRQRQ